MEHINKNDGFTVNLWQLFQNVSDLVIINPNIATLKVWFGACGVEELQHGGSSSVKTGSPSSLSSFFSWKEAGEKAVFYPISSDVLGCSGVG